MAYDKTAVVLYTYYEIISSYFKNCSVVNNVTEKNLFLHFKDANADFQCQCENFAIYSIENVLPKFIGNFDLEKYDAKISIDRSNNKLKIKTKDFYFEVIGDYQNNKESLTYTNIKKRKA